MKKPGKIAVVPLMPEFDRMLIRLLEKFFPDDREKPTRAFKWKVKDVAAHLLNGNFWYAVGNGIKKTRN